MRKNTCVTYGLYSGMKKYFFKFLDDKGVDLRHDRHIADVRKSNTMSGLSFEYLYKMPECQEALKEMLSTNYL